MSYSPCFGVHLYSGKPVAEIVVSSDGKKIVQSPDEVYAVFDKSISERAGMHTFFIAVSHVHKKIFVVGTGLTSGSGSDMVSVMLNRGVVDEDYARQAIMYLERNRDLKNFKRIVVENQPKVLIFTSSGSAQGQ